MVKKDFFTVCYADFVPGLYLCVFYFIILCTYFKKTENSSIKTIVRYLIFFSMTIKSAIGFLSLFIVLQACESKFAELPQGNQAAEATFTSVIDDG